MAMTQTTDNPGKQAKRTPKARKRGAHGTAYTPEIGNAVCSRIGRGATLTDSLKAEGVAMSTWFDWLATQPTLAEMYARGRESRGELLAEEIIGIADCANERNANAVRVMVDARKWCAARLAPKRWGDRVGVEHSGKDGGPLKVEVEVIGGVERDQNRTD